MLRTKEEGGDGNVEDSKIELEDQLGGDDITTKEERTEQSDENFKQPYRCTDQSKPVKTGLSQITGQRIK